MTRRILAMAYTMLWVLFILPGVVRGDEPVENKPAENKSEISPFILDEEPEDTPDIQRFKAALRLLTGYNEVVGICRECEMPEVMANYEKRNGNTLRLVVRKIQSSGGLKPNQKDVLDATAVAVIKHAREVSSCEILGAEIMDGLWDIYKAEKFVGDYKLMRSR